MSAPTLLNVCRIHLMDVDDCNLSTLHAHQIIHHMRHMIGIVSVTIRGQDIHVVHDPKEATPVQVENYLCAAVHPFGRRWRDAIHAAFRRTPAVVQPRCDQSSPRHSRSYQQSGR